MIDVTKLNKFVGMLGSEHAGERANAAAFVKRMADDEKLTLVEFLTKAYGGSSRVEYKERIVYRDRPTPSPNTEEQWRRARDQKDREADARRPKSSSYGNNGSITGKIRTVLTYHSNKLTDWEKTFLEGLIDKVDTGYEMTPRQRASYMKIMEKCGHA